MYKHQQENWKRKIFSGGPVHILLYPILLSKYMCTLSTPPLSEALMLQIPLISVIKVTFSRPSWFLNSSLGPSSYPWQLQWTCSILHPSHFYTIFLLLGAQDLSFLLPPRLYITVSPHPSPVTLIPSNKAALIQVTNLALPNPRSTHCLYFTCPTGIWHTSPLPAPLENTHLCYSGFPAASQTVSCQTPLLAPL